MNTVYLNSGNTFRVAALLALAGLSAPGLAAHPAMEDPTYFDPQIFARVNSFSHPVTEYRHLLNVLSLQRGLNQSSVALFDVARGPGREQVLERLLQRLDGKLIQQHGITAMEQDADHSAVYGDGWKLRVHGDGSRAEFRHYRYVEEREAALARLARLDADTLIERGHQFVEEVLGEQVKLGKREALVPFRVEYQVNAEQPADGRAPARETTVAGIVVFSRVIDGLDVLGAGSKIAVMFANDGTPFGFDMDWPQLNDSGRRQPVAPVQEIQARARRVARLGANAEDVALERFECGYFDAGQRHRQPGSPLQPACFHFYTGRIPVPDDNGGVSHLLQAYADPVPAAATVRADAHWPETLELRNGRGAGGDSETGPHAPWR